MRPPTALFSPYEDTEHVKQVVASGQHRAVIGGLWEELGLLQADFLKAQGLLPQHALIDIGAGSFRAGVKFVPYLNPGNYYATDLQAPLMEAGYTQEIMPAGLAERFPRCNFAANGSFDISMFARSFDFGLAQSVFTHMPIGRLGDCLKSITPHFRRGGHFFASMFLVPEDFAGRTFEHMPGLITSPRHDPFHTTRAALQAVAATVPQWRMTIIGDWSHPRRAQMVGFERLE
jgi:hypothetical protein